MLSHHCPGIISLSKDESLLQSHQCSELDYLLKNHAHRLNGCVQTHRQDSSCCDSSWLHPILLPSIFPTLFALYCESFHAEDCRATEMMERMTLEKDKGLCNKLGILR